MDPLLIILVILAIIALCCYFISNSLYKSLVKKNNPNAKTISVITFIVSFIFIAVGIFLLLIYNLRIER